MSNVKHSSESQEHYTPQWVVELCRELMGGIDLDPASSKDANDMIVRAKRYGTVEDSYAGKPWRAESVFLNPPGGLCDEHGRKVIRSSKATGRESCTVSGECGIPARHSHSGVGSSAVWWWRRLVAERDAGSFEQACFVVFSVELFQTSQLNGGVCPMVFPTCVFSKRLNFATIAVGEFGERSVVEGTQPTHANALVYLPPKGAGRRPTSRFVNLFQKHGYVVRPRSW